MGAVRTLLRDLGLSLLVFGALSVLLVGHFAFSVSMPLHDAVAMAARDWLPWAILTPFLFRIVFRFPCERGNWARALSVQALTAMAAMLLCTSWADHVIRPAGGPPRFQVGPRDTPLGPPMERPPDRSPWAMFFLPLGLRLPVYVAIAGIAHAFYFSRRAQERERRALGLEASLAKARLQALRMQLQPHFLFNSLNAIAELVHQDPDAADEMLVALSDFLRMTLDMPDDPLISLEREMEFINCYLVIEHIRLGERLQADFDLGPETGRALVPPLILQPLVENAVRHGLEPARQPGLLRISARREGGRLKLTVSDNGQGLRGHSRIEEGIGLTNTRARLAELFRGEATLAIRDGAGLTIDIEIPYRTP